MITFRWCCGPCYSSGSGKHKLGRNGMVAWLAGLPCATPQPAQQGGSHRLVLRLNRRTILGEQRTMEQVFADSRHLAFRLQRALRSIRLLTCRPTKQVQISADMAWSPSKADRPDCQSLVWRKGGPSPPARMRKPRLNPPPQMHQPVRHFGTMRDGRTGSNGLCQQLYALILNPKCPSPERRLRWW